MDKHLRSWVFFAAVLCSALSTAGCTTHQCDASTLSLGADAGGTGFWLTACGDPDGGCSFTWHSSDTMDSNWTDFPGNATVVFTFPPLPAVPAGLTADFRSAWPSSLVAATTPVNDDNFNVTVAAGQLAEYTSWSSTSIAVLNSSCQGYRFVQTLWVPIVPASEDPGLAMDGGCDAGDGGDAGEGGCVMDDDSGDAAADATLTE